MSFPKRTQLEGQTDRFTKIDFKNGTELVQNHETDHLLTHKNREVFLELCKRAKFKGEKLEVSGVKVELVGTRLNSKFVPRRYFKMQIQDETFFVKQIPSSNSADYGGGAKEITGMLEAEKLLIGLPNVGVVQYHVGYGDSHDTYLVSRWNDSLQTNLSKYLDKISLDPKKKEEQKDLEIRVDEIKKRLRPLFMDVGIHNMAFDDKSGKILIFDLIKKPDRDVN